MYINIREEIHQAYSEYELQQAQGKINNSGPSLFLRMHKGRKRRMLIFCIKKAQKMILYTYFCLNHHGAINKNVFIVNPKKYNCDLTRKSIKIFQLL